MTTMKTIYKNATVCIDGKANKTDFCVNQSKFDFDYRNAENIIDLTDCIVLPALLDIHTHGANGYDFNTVDETDLPKILEYYYSNGVGGILATIMTDDCQIIIRQLKIISKAAEKYDIIKGIHLEGPFLSHDYKGAMNEKYLLPPSIELFDKFQQAANGKIKLVTLSPELDRSEKLTQYLTKIGVTVSLGHSGASYTETMRCVQSGAKSFTHTFNAMKPIFHRDPSIAVAALTSDSYTEAITDGKHISPEIVKLIFKTKDFDKFICVTDSMMATGLPDGEYTLAGSPVTVNNGDAFLTGTQSRAGSVLGAFCGLKNFAEYIDSDIFAASVCYSLTPSKLLGIDNQYGSIAQNKYADFTVVKNGKPIMTFIKGNRVF